MLILDIWSNCLQQNHERVLSCVIMIILADIMCTWYNSAKEWCGISLSNDSAILSIYPFDDLTWKRET